ncbi:NAD(P)-dependent oxidoreductase [Geobacter sp. SVR]|uniref:NAD(P)-dependent oxidoreductase n=1 Tax=Geobacter sp. SVR TaxID=2495594 RepID=UPI00143EFC79|nr:NAD(P)-dependent oxidoreductase [Geobacter sp. SVR]BCS54631.1 3-hydroxyisobutyrate dehydrogenase [Geobacter sp. SVR]GCF86861.1 3-hydroxyisobutyrate dehydrogenase [Geobacter sp. SVR]
MNIGFVGLGIMGSAMAANLLKGSYRVTVWNRSAEKCRELAQQGAVIADSPRAAAESSDVVIAMMANPDAVRSVRDGSDGIIAGLASGKGLVDMSTVDAETSRESADLAQQKGALFLEAPVAGSRKPAEEATLTIMAAGDRELYDTVLPALEKMGRKIMFVGETGSAARMKLANNLVMAGMLTALCEGMALASKSGLDEAQLLDVLDSGAVSNPMFRLKGPQIAANGEFPVAFPLKHMQKDLRLALQLAESVGQPLFATAAINELFKAALAEGWGDLDFAAVGRTVRK